MIYIVRHGQTNWNLEKRNQGRKNIELNETGINQAKEISDKLKNINFDIVFSSPLKRAYKTAQIIYDKEIITDERLIERSNGDLEGKLNEDFVGLVDFADYNEDKYNIELLSDFRKRINSFLDEVLNKYKNKNILIVTHAGVSIYMKCYFDGEPANGDYINLKLKNCEVLKYDN